MDQKSTIQPKLTPLKAYYEKLNTKELLDLNTLPQKVRKIEIDHLKVLESLPQESREPTQSSIDIILTYSKQFSKENTVY